MRHSLALEWVTAVAINTHPQRVLSSVQTCVLVDVNQLLPWFFTRWPREHSFSVWALRRICRRFSRFCNILLQDLTPLHVKIARRKNLLSVSRRKLKLSTYSHTVNYNHISFLNRSQLVWVLASSGFYSITWRMISSKIHFREQPPFRGNFIPFRFKQTEKNLSKARVSSLNFIRLLWVVITPLVRGENDSKQRDEFQASALVVTAVKSL